LLIFVLAACSPAPSPAVPAAPAPAPAPAPEPGPPRLEPGVALGPFRIGMTRAEFEAAARTAGLAVRAGFTPVNAFAGPYFVAFTDPDERLSTVVAPFVEVGGLRVGDEVLPPSLRDAKDLAARLRCGPEERAEGGSSFACEGRVQVERRQPGDVAHVRIESEQTARLLE
jgi:hypothetical protein